MDNKIASIKERILYLIEYKGDTREDFFKKIGMTYGNFKGNAKNTPLNSNSVANILSIYTDISPDWLLTGIGPMLRANNSKHGEPLNAIKSRLPSIGIPLIPIHAMAGFLSGEVGVLDYECEHYVIPVFKGAEFLIQIKGSSMIPKYNSGDIVACKKLPLTDIFFQWNKVYVIDTAQGALVKRIRKGSNADSILLVSDNPSYEPFELHLSQLNAVALVIGVIRLE